MELRASARTHQAALAVNASKDSAWTLLACNVKVCVCKRWGDGGGCVVVKVRMWLYAFLMQLLYLRLNLFIFFCKI